MSVTRTNGTLLTSTAGWRNTIARSHTGAATGGSLWRQFFATGPVSRWNWRWNHGHRVHDTAHPKRGGGCLNPPSAGGRVGEFHYHLEAWLIAMQPRGRTPAIGFCPFGAERTT